MATFTRIINRARIITLLISIVKVERVRCIVVICPAISAVETTSSAVNGAFGAARCCVARASRNTPDFPLARGKRFCVGDCCTYINTFSGALFSSNESGTNGHRRNQFFLYVDVWQDWGSPLDVTIHHGSWCCGDIDSGMHCERFAVQQNRTMRTVLCAK